jgi:hypothetical protein
VRSGARPRKPGAGDNELLGIADRVATVDGDMTAREKEVIAELRSRCRRT